MRMLRAILEIATWIAALRLKICRRRFLNYTTSENLTGTNYAERLELSISTVNHCVLSILIATLLQHLRDSTCAKLESFNKDGNTT